MRISDWSSDVCSSDLQGEIDHRLAEQDRRIDKQGAMSAAMLNMATSAAGIRTQNRVGVGVGYQSGESALSIGYQRAISDRAVITIGGAFSRSEGSRVGTEGVSTCRSRCAPDR